MKNTIKCPDCGREIEVSQAISHQIEEQVVASLEEKHKKELENALIIAEEKALASVGKKLESEIENSKKEAEEEKERSRKLIQEITKLSDEKRELRRKDEEREILMKRKLADEEEKIREEAIKMEREKSNLDIAEYKKKLSDMEQALKDAQSKAKQGSQQLQGEVLELDLEEKLRSNFIYDEINPIGKGVQGADILQKVKNQEGKVAGIILWETKRAKWSPSWIAKLKEDGRKNDATMVVLVSEELPKDIDDFKVMDGVLVTSVKYSISIAGILRRSVMYVAAAKSASVNKDEKLEMLYGYITSDAFRHRFEAFSDSVQAMQEDLLTERRSMERIWKKREIQIQRISLNSSRMFGELQGVMGSELSDIKSLQLDSGEDE